MDTKTFECERCNTALNQDAKLCPSCGVLFEENLKCTNHSEASAEGACVICVKTFCNNCGSDIDDMFLCYEHENFEIIQGMTRVYGTPDVVQVEFAKDCLEQAGLHPFVYSRKASPLHLGGADYSLFRPSGDTPGHILNEIKLMVPTNEVLESIKVLTEVEIIND